MTETIVESRVVLRVDALVRLVRGRSSYLWVIDHCPHCGLKHIHGGGPRPGDPREYLGWRSPHCVGEYQNYFLVEDPRFSGTSTTLSGGTRSFRHEDFRV